MVSTCATPLSFSSSGTTVSSAYFSASALPLEFTETIMVGMEFTLISMMLGVWQLSGRVLCRPSSFSFKAE